MPTNRDDDESAAMSNYPDDYNPMTEECPVCGSDQGETDGCPCCEQYREGYDVQRPMNRPLLLSMLFWSPVVPTNPSTDEKPKNRSASYLTVPQFHRLSWACRPIKKAFGSYPYLVGSALYRPDYRDVDLRMPTSPTGERGMTDFTVDDPARLLFLNCAVSEWLVKSTGLPIDFQFQTIDEWDSYSDRLRNPMGVGS